MDTWTKVEITGKVFSEDAKEKIASIDLAEYGLDESLSWVSDRFTYTDEDVEYFDDGTDDEETGAFALMISFAEALHDDGIVEIVMKNCSYENEFQTVYVYYYFGDGIKFRRFYNICHDTYSFPGFLGSLLDMPAAAIEDTYHEMFGDEFENELDWPRHYFMAYQIAEMLGSPDLNFSKAAISKEYDGPNVAKLMKAVDDIKKKCCFRHVIDEEYEFDDEYALADFSPNTTWEQKGIVRYSSIEKKNLV